MSDPAAIVAARLAGARTLGLAAPGGRDGDGEPGGQDPDADAPPGRVSQATELVRLAQARYRFACSESGEPFGVPHDGPMVARMLRGGRGSLRVELAHSYARERGRARSSAALTDALAVLEGAALAVPREPLALRVAGHGDGVVLDLGDETGRAVVIEPGRWRVVDRSPVLFGRSELIGALPTPERGGSLDELRSLLNITDASWPLVVGSLVGALLPDIPHPILALLGEQGTGKTTIARLLARTVDPSPAQVRGEPRDAEGWALAAGSSWVVALDNLSSIRPWLADCLCRAVTGDGLVKRALYTDSSLSVVSFRRVVTLTAVDTGALRGDLGSGCSSSSRSGSRPPAGERTRRSSGPSGPRTGESWGPSSISWLRFSRSSPE